MPSIQAKTNFQHYYSCFDKNYYSTGAYDDYSQTSVKENTDLVLDLTKACQLNPKDRVLDVGCGIGVVVQLFRQANINALGVEVSDYALNNSVIPEYIHKASATSLPFPNSYFRLVTCIQVLYYFPQSVQSLMVKELVRVSFKFVYIDTISKGTKNSLQKYNPDKIRNQRNLLSMRKMQKIVADNKLKFIEIIEPSSINPDFHGLFMKN